MLSTNAKFFAWLTCSQSCTSNLDPICDSFLCTLWTESVKHPLPLPPPTPSPAGVLDRGIPSMSLSVHALSLPRSLHCHKAAFSRRAPFLTPQSWAWAYCPMALISWKITITLNTHCVLDWKCIKVPFLIELHISVSSFNGSTLPSSPNRRCFTPWTSSLPYHESDEMHWAISTPKLDMSWNFLRMTNRSTHLKKLSLSSF